MSGYVAGYDGYLASVGGSRGVPDPTCRGKSWVKPIDLLDAYLRMYQLVDLEGFAGDPGMWTGAQPPSSSTAEAAPSASALAAALTSGNAAPGSFNSSVAWTHTVTPSFPMSLYQLTLVPGHPTEYVYGGHDVAMTKQTSTVLESTTRGRLESVTRTLWTTRWGPVVDRLEGHQLPRTGTAAFVLADADTSNARFMNDVFATDQATDTTQILAAQEKYEGMPWDDTIAADSQGHAVYSDIGNFPDVTDALAARCDTALGAELYAEAGMPVFDGSNPSCTWGTDADSAAPGIFGANEEPKLSRSDYVENSNMSYWLTNASDPMTGYPRILGLTDIPVAMRTRSALMMVGQRLAGTDGLGPAGFTLQGV